MSTTIPGITVIDRVPLRDQCQQALRGLINSNALKAGELHSIGSVADQLGVSITPVREALLDLAGDGLIVMERNRGFRVVRLTDDDLDELVEMRILLEVPTVARVASLVPPPDLSDLRDLANEIVKCAASGDMVTFLALDRELHLRILERAGNGRLVRAVGLLRDQTHLYGLEKVVGTEEFHRSAAEHPELLDLIEAGDAEGAAALMHRHLLHTRGLWAGRAEDDGTES
ncbi:GntR family transcriptional regulator [Streptosporangium sp. NPDC006013]|uniref:GntR family transcriptional regulator n=1 Tax=Streptosporangium sp. NPDC006013 TaxID=3155596 RepID=UPI0033B68091